MDREDVRNASESASVFLNRVSGVRLSPGPPALPFVVCACRRPVALAMFIVTGPPRRRRPKPTESCGHPDGPLRRQPRRQRRVLALYGSPSFDWITHHYPHRLRLPLLSHNPPCLPARGSSDESHFRALLIPDCSRRMARANQANVQQNDAVKGPEMPSGQRP